MFSATPAVVQQLKPQVYIAIGSTPWFNSEWEDADKVIGIDESTSGQATVTCKGVTNMIGMFAFCFAIRYLNLSRFDTSNVTNMSGTFAGCLLTSLDLSNFDTSNVKNMSSMFEDCNNITTLDLSNFVTSKVTNMSYMFNTCSRLTSLDVSKFNTSNVTDMSNMFYSCNSLTTLDLSNFDTSKVTNMGRMFNSCFKLTTIKGIIDMKSCIDYEDMFYNCPKLTGVKIKNPPSGFDGAGLSKSQYTIVS